jgi:hypothetical protein
MKNKLFILALLLCLSPGFAQTTRDHAIENITSVLFDTKTKDIKERIRSFENANNIKLHFRVQDESLDKLGGLSEHLFRIFQNFTTPANTNARCITAEFSALSNSVLSDLLLYKTLTTSDLANCMLPDRDTRRIDSIYNKGLSTSFIGSAHYADEVPSSLDGLYLQSASDYERVIFKHQDCPGIFDVNEYNQHVINTRSARKTSWSADAGAISLALTTDFGLLNNNSIAGNNSNSGNTGVNVNVNANLLQGRFVINLNNSVNECTQKDMEVRSRILFKKANINFLFLTQTIPYYLPLDSLNTFRDAAVQALENAYGDKNLIVALWLKMTDSNGPATSAVLLVKQNGNWLTNADIDFAKYNNGGGYTGSTVYKYRNLYRNIPKPLVLCYQVAKVNGLLTTSYFSKGQAVKGREQIYNHVFKVDKAFEEIGQLNSQLLSLYQQGGSGGGIIGANNLSPQLYREIESLHNKIKLSYLKAAKSPQFNEAEEHFKEIYLQDKNLAHVAALRYVKNKYGQLYSNNELDELIGTTGLPDDLRAGSCTSGGESDVIADFLGVASLLLAPTGLDIIPDALSVAWFASNGKTLDMLLASASFVMPGSLTGAKKVLNDAASQLSEIRKGSSLLIESGQVKAIQQDINLMTALFGIKPSDVDATTVGKINTNSSAVDELLTTSEQKLKLYSNVSEKLPEAKRVEFLNKALDEGSWRSKVLDDPDEVLRWGGVYGKWLDDLEIEMGSGTKQKVINWINKGLSDEKLEIAFSASHNKQKLLQNLEGAKSIYHQRVIICDWDNIPGIAKSSYSFNGLTAGLTHSAWNDPQLDLPSIEARNFRTAEATTLSSGTKIYRITGGNPGGGYWTLEIPKTLGEVIGGTSVRPEWNSFQNLYVYEIPYGQTLKVWKGKASRQAISENISSPHLPGGIDQIYVPEKYRDNNFINIITKIQLPW